MPEPSTPVPIESLLAEREWVHRVARALVADPAGADDLEQETWMRAQASPPRHGGSLRAWLGTVMRRLASDMRRSEKRRRQREEAAARPERLRSTADLVAEAEALKRVVSAVLECGEPYRTTLLLRYVEELPSERIAERLGVPLETVRTRLKRGLALLRTRLDAGPEGDRRGWLSAVLPLLDRDPVGPAPTPGGVPVLGTALGALLMTMKSKAVIGVATLLVVALGIAVAVRPAAEDAPRQTASTPPPIEAPRPPGLLPALASGRAEADPRSTQADSADPASVEAPVSPKPDACRVAIEVLDELGHRVRQGSVRLHPGGSALSRADVVGKMAVDMDRYEWLSSDRDLAKGNPLEVNDIPAEFAGMEIEAQAVVPPYSPIESPSVTLKAGEVVRVRVDLVPGRRVEFDVRDADGRPIANARVVSMTETGRRGINPEDVLAPDGTGWATTGADGRCTVTELGPGAHDIEVLAAGFRPGRIDDASIDAGPIAVRLQVSHDDAVLEVIVRDPTGAPVPGMRVLLNTRLRLTPLVLETDAFGIARFTALPPGLQVVHLDSRAWVPLLLKSRWGDDKPSTTFGFLDDLPAGETRRIALGYSPVGGSVRCEVVDGAGAPLKGIHVRLFGPLFPDGTTDAEGRIEFRDLAAGSYRTIVWRGDGPRWFGEAREVADGAKIEVRRVLGDRTVRGVVRAAGEGHPVVAGAGVTLHGAAFASTDADDDGSFLVRDVAPGHYSIEAEAAGFVNATAEIEVSRDDDAQVSEILLVRGGRILLRVLPADSSAIALAKLRLVASTGKEIALLQDSSGGADYRRTDRLSPGRYVLEIARGERDKTERAIDVREGEDAIVVLPGP